MIDLNGMPLCQKYKHIHELLKKNTLMEPTFILKSSPDVFAEASILKLELLRLYLYFSQKPDADWLADLLVRRGKKKKNRQKKTAETPAPDFVQQCVHVLICFIRGGGIKTSCVLSASRRSSLCNLASKQLS